MAVNIIGFTVLAAIGVATYIKQGAIMATQEQLVAEVSDLRDAYVGISEYINTQDLRIQNLREQLETANANSASDLSPLIDLVDEIQAHRDRLVTPPVVNEPAPSEPTPSEPVPAEPVPAEPEPTPDVPASGEDDNPTVPGEEGETSSR